MCRLRSTQGIAEAQGLALPPEAAAELCLPKPSERLGEEFFDEMKQRVFFFAGD